MTFFAKAITCVEFLKKMYRQLHSPWGETSEEDHQDQAGFLGPEVLLFHHSCPVPQVLLTHERGFISETSGRLKLVAGIKEKLLFITTSSLTGKSSKLLRRPTQKMDKLSIS